MSDSVATLKDSKPPTGANVMPAAEPAIRVDGVRKRYGDIEVLKGVDLTLAAGQFTAIMGKSGSGKSTLLGVIAGLEKPDAGEVFIMGQKLEGTSDRDMAELRRRAIGIVFQGFSLIPSLTALDNVLLPAFFATGTTPAERHERAVDLLRQVGLGARLNYRPSTLKRRRAAACRHSSCAHEWPVHSARRRTHRQPRPGDRRGGAQIADRSRPNAWHRAADGDPRSRRGGEGRQCRRNERWKDCR